MVLASNLNAPQFIEGWCASVKRCIKPDIKVIKIHNASNFVDLDGMKEEEGKGQDKQTLHSLPDRI